jgi:NitT/TauT family transport system substrate-binding protein
MTANLVVKSSAAALAWMTVCVGPVLAQKVELTVLRIQQYQGSITNTPGWVAKDAGFCEANGIKCEFINIPSGPLGLQALASKSIEVSFASTDVAMQSAARGNDIQLIVGTEPKNIFSLCMHVDVPLPHLSEGYPDVMKDFEGRRIGVTGRGAASEIEVHALLDGAGISPNNAIFVGVGPPSTAYPALKGKTVDAVFMFEPVPTICKHEKICTCPFNLQKGEGPKEMLALNYGYQNYMARREFIRTNQKEIDGFIRAISEAIAWIQKPENVEKTIAIVERNMSLGNIKDGQEILRELVKSQIPLYGAWTKRSVITSFNEFLLKYKLISKPLSSDSFVYAKAP